MKKLSIICTLILAVGMMSAGDAFAVGYCKDITGGGAKNFQDTLTLNESDTVTLDIYLNDIRTGDHLISAGFFAPYSSSIEIVSVTPDAAWDPAMVNIDTSTPNVLFVGVGNFSGVGGDVGNDVLIATIEVHCLTYGFDEMVFMPDPEADMIVSLDDSYVYDGDITANIFIFNQVRCCGSDLDCDDGLYCNGVEYCLPDADCPLDTGKCFRAPAIDCDDAIDCTVDACNETNDNCDNIPDDGACSDGIDCTDDACDQLGAPGSGCSNTPNDGNCDDSNICTDDACDQLGAPGSGCSNVNNSDPCDDGLYCNGADTCSGGSCDLHAGDPCDDGDPCSDDTCTEGSPGSCTNECNAVSAVDPCCDATICDGNAICAAGGSISIGDFWANCGDVGVKIDLCLQNLEIPVGGLQIDLCEDVDDCLICTECELTERTVVFDCVVNELPNGCCRVILFAKHPGGLINPGECDVVTIVYEIRDDPICCDTCIEIDGENIVLSDEYGYDVLGVIAGTGEVCPFVCGDVEPGCSSRTCSVSAVACTSDDDCVAGPTDTCTVCATMDCGDGDVDLFDILEEIGFALGTDTPDDCQGNPTGPRDDVPTGTPIILPAQCLDPDGVINILDVMVLIDMALGRQDCCSYYYAGIII